MLTFDRLSSVFLSNTNHEEDQPVHLQVKDMELQKRSEHAVYAGPSTRYCPAGVYEWVDGTATALTNPARTSASSSTRRTASTARPATSRIPNQNINWVPPQGGEGPVYQNM